MRSDNAAASDESGSGATANVGYNIEENGANANHIVEASYVEDSEEPTTTSLLRVLDSPLLVSREDTLVLVSAVSTSLPIVPDNALRAESTVLTPITPVAAFVKDRRTTVAVARQKSASLPERCVIEDSTGEI